MKKYTQPELSVSMFDIEDIITASGMKMDLGGIIEDLGGAGAFYQNGVKVENVDSTAAAYFNWNAK